ncbi:type I-B CRISPR-associated endonuclease Cas1b [Miniphocaeibacter halophilus]|uniref:type I-B CRISPR-associated endonuclease Cas1b n=1 Tax=Miniphocaeibacter halophilus TaxID=2931922 RepID=UPI001FB213FE|nr:type I-B CRISPR-associated endonuclease Cas1b [Miniphocaeibacter halophilus]
MKETFYITKSGTLRRKDNNIVFENSDGTEVFLKSEKMDELYLFGEIDLNTRLLNFLSQMGITLNVFNYYGYYSGSYYPRESKVSGYLLVEQVKTQIDLPRRMKIAKEIVCSAARNIYRNLRYYNKREVDLSVAMSEIEYFISKIDEMENINSLMGIEGNIRKIYYDQWTKIIKQDVEFEKRVKRPPDNMVNTLISFLNSMMYTTVLSEIYKTQLNPTVSFLHEPGNKRFSLALDIAEIFKPLIVDRMIFSMLNKKQITKSHFIDKSRGLELTDVGLKILLGEYENRLKKVLKHKGLKREVSYRYLIRLECYKLMKSVIGEKRLRRF